MRWQPDVIGLHVASDLAIALAYFSIPVVLMGLLRKRRDISFSWLFAAFALFILACGATHVMDVVTLWTPLYRLAGILKAITAIVSITTAVALVRIWPDLLELPTTSQLRRANEALQAEVERHRATKEALEAANAELSAQVIQKYAQFKTTFESAAIGLAHVAPDGSFLRVNQHLCNLLGYTQQELLAFSFADVTHPDDLAADWALARGLLGGRDQTYSMQKRYLDKQGEVVWATLHVSLVRDASGEPDYFISAVKDVTDQKRAEFRLQETVSALAERERQLELIFERAELGDWRWDIVRNETYAHPIVFRQYGSADTVGPVHPSWFFDRQHPDDRAGMQAALNQALESQPRFDLEFRVIHPDGSIRWLACRGSVARDQWGRPIATHGVSLDITARKEAEAALYASAAELGTLTEVLPQLLWFANPSGEVEFFNRQWYEYTGQTSGRALNWGWQPVIHPDDLDRCLKTWKQSLSTGQPYDVEYRLKRADGAYRWHLGRALPVYDGAKQTVRWFGSCTDIEDLKCAEAELRSLQEGLELQVAERTAALIAATELNRRILESSPDCIQVLDIGGNLTSSNPAARRALGLASHDESSGYWPQIWPVADQDLAVSAISTAGAGEQGGFQSLCVDKQGRPNWWDVRVSPIPHANGQPDRLLAVWRNITAQKLAEQAATDAKQRLELALRGAQIGAWTWDVETDQMNWHQHCAMLHGLPNESTTSDIAYLIQLIHPDDRSLVNEKIAAALESGHYEAEYRIVWPDGSVRVLSAWGEVSFQNAKAAQLAGICWDITVRKEAEQALQVSESRLREAQQIAQLGHWEFDLMTKEIHWSEETFRIFSVRKEGGISYEQILNLIPATDRNHLVAAIDHAIATGEPYELTHRVLCPDGSFSYVDSRGRLERDASGAPSKLLGTVLDVTARVQASIALQGSHDQLERRIAERTHSLRDEISFREITERNLRDAERRLAVALRFSGVATWIWNRKTDQISWTGPVQSLFRRTPAELNSLAAFEGLIVPADLKVLRQKLQDAITSGAEYETEFRIQHRDGSVRWMVSRGGASSVDGVVTCVSGVNFDVTEKKLAEQEMAASEARFRQLADGMPQMVWTAQPDGEVDYANDAWSSYCGLPADEIRNWGWTSTVHPDDLQTCVEAWTRAFESGRGYEVEFRVKRASDGVYRWHRARALPIRDADGQIVKWLGTCPDIDDYKRVQTEILALNRDLEARVEERTRELSDSNDELRRTQAWLQAVLDSATEASIVAIDNGGNISIFNAGAERLLGYSASEMLGQAADHFAMQASQQLGTSKQSPPTAALLGTKQPDAPFLSEGIYLRKDGRSVDVSLAVTPMIDSCGERIGTLAIAIDIGARKVLEHQLSRNNDQLQEQTRRAEDANRAKSDFLAAMSHEIRTPMNAILGMSELLWETDLQPDQRQYVEIFRRAGANLLTLVNDILDLSKIESGHFDLESVPFDLNDVVERTVEMIRPKAHAKHLTLHVEFAPGTPSRLVGDPTRMQQILLNLLGNAVKFTAAGRIGLAVSCQDAKCGHLLFEVSDTGIGIPADKLGTIFNDFTQAESSTTRRFGGTGLGLGICRRLVDRMGGQLRVRSEYGKGSSFLFDAKFKLAEGKPETTADKQMNLSGRRALVVDENRTDRLIFAEMCDQWGIQTSVCTSPAEALVILRKAADAQDAFDLVIADRCAEGAGFDFAIEARSQHPGLAIILTTGDEVPGEATRSKELGLAGYAAKPVRRSDLLRMICDALSGSTRAQKSESPSPSSHDETPRVLIAEDSEDNRFLLQAYLKKTPYELVFVETGELAVAACRSQRFDLVLMDMQMPVMDGLTATRIIRSDEQRAGRIPVPIVALTANARAEDVAACQEAGFTSHLSKPIGKAKLLAAVEQHLARKSSPVAVDPGIEIPAGLESAALRYIRSRQKEAAEMRQLLFGRAFSQLQTIGHNMKGTGLPYGFPAVTELGGQIETAARESDAATLSECLLRLSEYVERAVQIVESKYPATDC